MTAEALFLTFAGSINAVADGLYILVLAAGANWLARTTHTRAAAIPIELKTRGLPHKLAAIDAIISVATRLTLAACLTPVALVVVPLSITAASLYITGHVVVIGK
jgi:hypothetical protein